MLSAKPIDWVAEVSATPEVLTAPESYDVARHALSTATSRKPQAFLFEAIRDRIGTTIADGASARIVALLGEFGTVQTVGLLCEELGKVKASVLIESDSASLVVAAVARRIDEGKGLRSAFFDKVVAAITPARFTEHAGTRRVLSALSYDANYAGPIAKVLQSKSAKAFLATQLTAAKPLPDTLAFVTDLMASSARSGAEDLVEVVCVAMGSAIEPLMAPSAPHRPRPEILSGLARASPERVAAGICRAATKWADLSKQIGTVLADALALAAQHAPTADAQAFATKVASLAPLNELVTRCTHSARLIVALRKLGLLSGAANEAAGSAIDAVEDTLNCQSSSCAAASRSAAQRAIARAETVPAGRERRPRPVVAVVDSDEDEEEKPKARKSARAEKKASPRRK